VESQSWGSPCAKRRQYLSNCQLGWHLRLINGGSAVHGASGHCTVYSVQCTVATTGSRQESAFCVVADTQGDKNKPRRKLVHVRFSTAETQFKGDTLTRRKYKNTGDRPRWTSISNWTGSGTKKWKPWRAFIGQLVGERRLLGRDYHLWDKWRKRC